MKIMRYSLTGFKPQYQSHKLNDIDYYLHRFNVNEFPQHLQEFAQQDNKRMAAFYREHFNDFQYGVWAFIDGYKSNLALNHLQKRVPCWKAEISNNTMVYVGEKRVLITDDCCKSFGFYIPVNQLNSLEVVND